MNKKDNFKEKFKQALISTVKVISDDYRPKKDGNNASSKNIIAEYYQRCFGEDLPESMINIQI